ncbi:MAG: WbqC family protein [Prolixibacteraceae bacterium]|nr:WbqC family protein [Prolixibacteraceae bacterium]
METVILSTAYLGPVIYYSAMHNARNVLIEQYDSYIKQTYRNRCTILAANGPQNLVVPVVKTSGQKQMVKDVKIDYSTRWQANHWRSIFSAYNSSPFFQYYCDQLHEFYKNKWKFLIDFNTELMLLMIDELGIECNYALSSSFVKEYSDVSDFRKILTPKTAYRNYGLDYSPVEYSQTFSERFGFVPNLSIIDLLFNTGPGAEEILKKQAIFIK